MQIFLHLSTAKGVVITSSLHYSTALPLTAVLLWNEMTRGVLISPSGNWQPLSSHEFTLLALCFYVLKHKSYYGLIQNRSVLIFIDLPIHHISTCQPVTPTGSALINCGKDLIFKKKKTSNFYLVREAWTRSTWYFEISCLDWSCFSLVVVVAAGQWNMCLWDVGLTTEHLSHSMSVSNFSHACFQWIGVYQATA